MRTIHHRLDYDDRLLKFYEIKAKKRTNAELAQREMSKRYNRKQGSEQNLLEYQKLIEEMKVNNIATLRTSFMFLLSFVSFYYKPFLLRPIFSFLKLWLLSLYNLKIGFGRFLPKLIFSIYLVKYKIFYYTIKW